MAHCSSFVVCIGRWSTALALLSSLASDNGQRVFDRVIRLSGITSRLQANPVRLQAINNINAASAIDLRSRCCRGVWDYWWRCTKLNVVVVFKIAIPQFHGFDLDSTDNDGCERQKGTDSTENEGFQAIGCGGVAVSTSNNGGDRSSTRAASKH